MSAASSRLAPYFSGMEKIRLRYLSSSADHARSSPFRQPRMRRASLHVRCGPLGKRKGAGLPDSSRGTGRIPAPEQLLDVQERVMVENRRMQIAMNFRDTYDLVR